MIHAPEQGVRYCNAILLNQFESQVNRSINWTLFSHLFCMKSLACSCFCICNRLACNSTEVKPSRPTSESCTNHGAAVFTLLLTVQRNKRAGLNSKSRRNMTTFTVQPFPEIAFHQWSQNLARQSIFTYSGNIYDVYCSG